jgi:hypothetical protein
MRWGTQCAIHCEDLVAQNQLAGALLGESGVVLIVKDSEINLTTINAAILIDVVKVGLSRYRDVLVAGGCRTGQWCGCSNNDFVIGDTWVSRLGR